MKRPLTTKSNDFRNWVQDKYKKDPNLLKPIDLHNKFIVYLAWTQAQLPKKPEKHQPYLMDIN